MPSPKILKVSEKNCYPSAGLGFQHVCIVKENDEIVSRLYTSEEIYNILGKSAPMYIVKMFEKLSTNTNK
jgi:hypothetical protein